MPSRSSITRSRTRPSTSPTARWSWWWRRTARWSAGSSGAATPTTSRPGPGTAWWRAKTAATSSRSPPRSSMTSCGSRTAMDGDKKDGDKIHILLLGALLALGCHSTAPQPVARADQPKEETKAPAAAPSKPSEPPAPAAAPPREGDAAPVVVDPGVDGATTPRTLIEASRAEKERRASAGKPVAVITDKTLPKYASKGQITVADPKKDKKAAKAPATTAPAQALKDEQYWRGRARELRE